MKNKLIYLFAVLLFTFSCSVDRMQETLAIEGVDGNTTLVNVTTLPEGSESCPAGGTQLSFGIDTDEDGSLSEDEITSSASVCNGIDGEDGIDGTSALVEVTAIQPDEEYPNGGVLITNGYDLNNNGTLEEDEIANTTVVENGVDGTNGTDGLNTLVRTTRIFSDVQSQEGEETVLSECPLGGFLIESGLDSNRDGILQDGEVNDTATNYVCDGENGKSLAVRLDVVQGGEEFQNGGTNITIGLDQNDNGVLDENESGVTFFVSNGNDGVQGIPGLNGSNGFNNISTQNPYFVDNVLVGTMVEYGLDTNNNGTLEEIEVSGFYIVLNGEDGENGLQGPKGDVGETGQEGPAGPRGRDGEDGVNAFQIRSFSTRDGNTVTVNFYLDINRDGSYQSDEDQVVNVFTINDGTDGLTPVVTYETVTNGTRVIITVGDEITSFIVEDGEQGEQGEQGLPGVDGNDGKDGECPLCDVCTETTVTLCFDDEVKEYTFAEYIDLVYNEFNGDASEIKYGDCFEPIRIAVKDPHNNFGNGSDIGYGNGANCHWNWSEIYIESPQQLIDIQNQVPYPSQSFKLKNNRTADEYDCKSRNQIPNGQKGSL